MSDISVKFDQCFYVYIRCDSGETFSDEYILEVILSDGEFPELSD